MKRKKHPPGIPGCPKNRTRLRKGWIAGIVVIAVIALLFVGYNLYRYPAMFQNLSDNSLNDSQVEKLREEILSQPDVNVLVAYFSYSGTTRNVATALSEKTGGDLFEITPQDGYSNVYMESNSEIRSNERPALTDTVENMEDYDIVFVGYPVWWIYLEGSEINYPIAQAEDNSYYLKHLFDKSSNSPGCIFLDCRNTSDFTDRHSIIYGHHMKNGTMFSGLDSYKSQEYYNEHPQLLLLTPEQNYVIEIFAGYVVSVQDDAWQVDFASEEDFEEWVRRAIDRFCFTSSITPAATARIITLSTCSYEFNNARFVLLGVIH